MYESFFGFKEKPFNNTPDPKFLYFSKKHKEALAQLIYGIKERKGFVVLSGEVGTGKTTIVRALLKQLDPNSQVAYIFNTKLSVMEFLRYVCHDFGLRVNGDSKTDYVTELLDFMVKSHHEGKTTTLILDEAQKLDIPLLEEIRMLTNLESSSEKLLQVFLVGQPELNNTLERHELWQLKQRISTRYHLFPLDRQETRGYIQTRMRIAGARRLNYFTDGAIKKIYKYSRGIPRLINNICDNALLVAYASNTAVINEKIIRECVADLNLKRVPKIYKTQRKTRVSHERRSFLYAGLIIIFVGILAQGIAFFLLRNKSLSERFEANKSFFQQDQRTETKVVSPVQQETITEEKKVLPQSKTDLTADSVIAETRPMRSSHGEPMGESGKNEISSAPGGHESLESRIAIARDGDSISEIIFREFGRVDEHLLEAVKELNPEVEDLDWIIAGQEIRLPQNVEGTYKAAENTGHFSQDIDSGQERSRTDSIIDHWE